MHNITLQANPINCLHIVPVYLELFVIENPRIVLGLIGGFTYE